MGTDPARTTHCVLKAAVTRVCNWLVRRLEMASEHLPELNWGHITIPRLTNDSVLLPGPRTVGKLTLFFLNCINNARERVWIASTLFRADVQ